ncbi:MAG: ATP-binding protein [Alphaproteobacteria bacterium]
MKKSPLSIRNILLLTIGTLSLLVALFTLQQVYQEWQRMTKFHALKEAMILGDQLFDAAEKLTAERDITFIMLHSPDAEITQGLARNLSEDRPDVDQTLNAALTALRRQDIEGLETRAKQNGTRLLSVRAMRKEADEAAQLPSGKRDGKLASRWFDETTALISEMRSLWLDFISRYDKVDPYVTLQSRFKFFLGSITEDAGQERALIGRLLVRNARPTPQEQAQLLRWQGRMEQGWEVTASLGEQSGVFPGIEPSYKDAHSHYLNLRDMMHDIFYVPGKQVALPYPISPDLWLELANETTDSLYALKDAALQASQAYIDSQTKLARSAIVMRLGVLLLSLALCLYSFRVVTQRVLRPIHDIAEALLRTSQGEEVVPVTIAAERKDEIGQLAQVLRSFQRTMEDMKRYTRDLERSNKELDDFAYIASHDLKEPLRGISNHARFLHDDNEGKLSEDSQARIGRLVFLSQRIERLINDLLYFSRLGRQELAIQPTDMNEMLRDVEGTLVEFLKQNNARLSIPRALPVFVCDKVRVMEVFRNLIVNAVKYNKSPEKTVEIGFLDVCPLPGDGAARDVFYVKDNGIGILPEFHQDIFRIFRRLERPLQGKEREDGTGVGLTFVKKIVERHGGKIWLESDSDKGTTFYFTLKEDAAKPERKSA